MLPMLRDGGAPENHLIQYFEIMGNRGLYHEGWTAVTKHRTPWKVDAPPPFDEDIWELYGPDDWTQAHNLVKSDPAKLAELQRLWLIEAVKYNVVPLDDRSYERINPDLAGRPQLIAGNTQLLFPGMRVSENCVVNLKNKSHSVTANLAVPESGVTGVIVTQGGAVGGWSLYAYQGKLKYCYNFFGIDHFMVTADRPIPAGAHQVRMEFAYDGGGLAKGGTVSLYYDGTTVGQGRVEQTIPFAFSGDETMDIGHDTGTPVSADYAPHDGTFTGTIEWVQIETGKIAADQEVPAEERIRVALVRQ